MKQEQSSKVRKRKLKLILWQRQTGADAWWMNSQIQYNKNGCDQLIMDTISC